MNDMFNKSIKTITTVVGMICATSIGKEGIKQLGDYKKEKNKNNCELDKVKAITECETNKVKAVEEGKLNKQKEKTKRCAMRCKTVTDVAPDVSTGLARFAL